MVFCEREFSGTDLLHAWIAYRQYSRNPIFALGISEILVDSAAGTVLHLMGDHRIYANSDASSTR